VNFENIEELILGADLVLDGTDNFETRYLINDACVKARTPWIYGAAVGSYGLTMTIIPDETPCLRCVLEAMPRPRIGANLRYGRRHSAHHCRHHGDSMRGSDEALDRSTRPVARFPLAHRHLDFQINRLDLSGYGEREACPACGKREFEFLKGAGRQVTTTLCGRNAVQIGRSGATRVDFAQLAERLKAAGEVAYNDFLLRFRIDDYDITVFRDGPQHHSRHAGPAIARGLYARYIGA